MRDVPDAPSPNYHYAPAPQCYRCPIGHTYPNCKDAQGTLACVKATEHLIRSIGPETIAGFLTEPAQGAGMISIDAMDIDLQQASAAYRERVLGPLPERHLRPAALLLRVTSGEDTRRGGSPSASSQHLPEVTTWKLRHPVLGGSASAQGAVSSERQ